MSSQPEQTVPVRYNLTVKKGFDFDAVKHSVEQLGLHVDDGNRALRFLTGVGQQGLEEPMRNVEGVSRAAMNRDAELADALPAKTTALVVKHKP